MKLKDIAERAGVSIATVSMALSGKGKISSDVCDRIIAIADELDYRRPGTTVDRRLDFRYVTILHSESYRYSWNFSYTFIEELESHLIKKGYYPLVIHMNEHWQAATIVNEIRTNHSGAVFSIDFSNRGVIPKLEELGLPIVVINNSSFQDRYHSVLADDIQGSWEGANRLIAAGHKSIVYAEFERPEMSCLVHDRYAGFRQAMEEAGIPLTEDLHMRLKINDEATLERRLSEIFRAKKRPTAIFAHDDYFAACIISGLRKLGLIVPYDVSIIAPGDVLDYSQPFLPRISTMKIDLPFMSRMAVDLMMACIAKQGGEPLVIKTKLHYVDRGSIRKV
jgi:DNA-binding LacI/PurR family transcriptional regulator